MKTIEGFSIGVKSFFKAIPFIFKHKLWWTFAIPIVLNIMMYIAGFSFMDFMGDLISTQVDQWLDISNDSKLMQAIPGFLTTIIKLLLQIVFFFIYVFFSGYIILIILSPLFAYISEKTDQLLNNVDYPLDFAQLIKDMWRGIKIAIRNLFFEIGATILILIATLLPFIGQILSPFTFLLYFLIASYFYGFSFMDYTNERKRLPLKQSVLLIRKYKGIAIANGAIFSLSLILPFCGVLLAGFVAIISTVGATIAMNEIPELKEIRIEPKTTKLTKNN